MEFWWSSGTYTLISASKKVAPPEGFKLRLNQAQCVANHSIALVLISYEAYFTTVRPYKWS